MFSALVTGFVAYTTLNFYATGIEADTLITVFLQGLSAGVAGLCGGFGAYYVSGNRELREMFASLHKRLFKADVVGPQDEDQLAL